MGTNSLSDHEFPGENLWGQGGAGQSCHNGRGHSKVEGDRGYADEKTGLVSLKHCLSVELMIGQLFVGFP